MRLKLEGEAWGYRASPDLGATDPTLPLTTRMALARRTMRVQEAEFEAKEAECERVQRGHERSRRARSGTIPSFQAWSMVTKPSEAVSEVRSNVRNSLHRARAIENAIINQSANVALNGTPEYTGHASLNMTTPKKKQ